jgi:hypothetical protein
MAEIVTLTASIPKPAQTLVKLERLTVDVKAKLIYVQWEGDDGTPGSAAYPTPAPQGSSQPTGAALIAALNTANFSANSLVHHIFTRLQTDGYLPAGTVSGVPD